MKSYNQLFGHTAVLIALLFSIPTFSAEDQSFDSDGVTINYQVLGSGVPVILVHGLMSDFESNWSSVIEVLTPHFQVIGIDARGHGKSGKPHDDSAYGVQMVTDVANLMDHLSIDRAHVAGYSMGGFIVLKMASIYPDRLLSAVTAGNGLLTPDYATADSAEKKPLMQLAIDQNISVVDAIFAGIPPSVELPPSMVEIFEGMRSRDHDPRALLAYAKAFDQLMTSTGDAAAIHVPLLAIRGSLDDLQFNTIDHLKVAAPDTEVIILEGEDHGTTPSATSFAHALRDFFLNVGE